MEWHLLVLLAAVAAEDVDFVVGQLCGVAGAEEAEFPVGLDAGVVEACGEEFLRYWWGDGVGEGGVGGEEFGVCDAVVESPYRVGPCEEGG